MAIYCNYKIAYFTVFYALPFDYRVFTLLYQQLHLTTQAGTYIKEFVHGDLGRTTPSLGSLLGLEVDIIALDVEVSIIAEICLQLALISLTFFNTITSYYGLQIFINLY